LKIALFATGNPGLAVSHYLSESGDTVDLLFLAGQHSEADFEIERAFSNSPVTVRGEECRNEELLSRLFSESKVEAIVSVYWPWVIPQRAADMLQITVNFHPSLLPYGRGWYPHVHNIIKGSRAGVSLHEISTPVDSGKIWAQREVQVAVTDTASDLHARLQKEIVELFVENWPAIRDGGLTPTAQSGLAVYFAKNAFDKSDTLVLDQISTVREVIDTLRARSFGGRGYAHFYVDGRKISISISLKEESV
jgi:methionyl-tRNA formyltransferase